MQSSSVHPPAQAGDVPATYLFDRRRNHRYVMTGRVTMLRRAHTTECHRQPICCVQLEDLSDGGVSAHSDMPLAIDEPVAVLFPPCGPQRGVDLLGHVIRCDPDHDGYHLAVAFDRLPAA